MKRRIDIRKDSDVLNPWVKQSLELFNKEPYLDMIHKIYPFEVAKPQRLDNRIRREIIQAHQSRNTDKLIELLTKQTKFPYEDPTWFLLRTVKNCLKNNPKQIKRIADSLYSMTAEETILRIESPPKLNTQIGPMFNYWLRKEFNFITIDNFIKIKTGIVILDETEQEWKNFATGVLEQQLSKRPDFVAKANNQYIIGEAKWIGQPGGNQEKQVQEVINFCRNQRGLVKRIGIVDGFPWAIYNVNGSIINNKEAILIQESEYDILSALLLKKYLKQF